MPRWPDDARGRLLRSAVELFGANGYDATTSAQIAEHAGLTKTTLFRHFADKREILFQGQQEQIDLATSAVESAPPGSDAFDVMAAGILAVCGMHPQEHRELGRRIDAIAVGSAELQERARSKRAALTQAVSDALVRRGVGRRRAGVLADTGARAFYEGYASWISSARRASLETVVRGELAAYRGVLAEVTSSPGRDG